MPSTLIISSPVRGEWAILNPPGHPRLAYDFLAVSGGRNPYRNASLLRHVFWRIGVAHTLAWGMPVHAVLPGRVVAASDGTPDRANLSMIVDLVRLAMFGPEVRPPFSNLGGNHVIIDCGGVFPLYAHLRRGSVRVRPGQAVAVGDVLGSVGNSGSSLQPHLHFQVMSSPDPFPLFRNLLPIALAGVRRWCAGRWVDEIERIPANGDRYLLS